MTVEEGLSVSLAAEADTKTLWFKPLKFPPRLVMTASKADGPRVHRRNTVCMPG
jgi:hypothetical protein